MILALLLKDNAELRKIFAAGALYTVDRKVGTKPSQIKDKVVSTDQWTDTVLIFMSIYLVQYPEKALEL